MKRMKFRAVAVFAASAVLLVSGSAISSGTTSKSSVIKVAVLFDKTGAAGPYGLRALNGYNLALSQARAAGLLKGVTIRTTYGDPGSVVGQSATLAQEAVSAGENVIVYGMASAEGLAMEPIADSAGIPLLTATNAIPPSDKNAFMVLPKFGTFHGLFAHFLGKVGVKKLAFLMQSGNPDYAALEAQFQAFGQKYGFAVNVTQVPATQTDYSSVSQSILATNPGAIDLILYGPGAATMVGLLDQAHYTGIVGGQTISGFLPSVGTQADWLIAPAEYAADSSCRGEQAFGKAFAAKYGQPADETSANGYNAGLMLARAIQLSKGNYSHSNFRKSLAKVEKAGITNTSTCTLKWQNGAATIPGALTEVVNGTIISISP